MIRPTRALIGADRSPLDLESIVTALGAQFAVTVGARQLVRRRQLDTFDRRLQAAGLTLEHQVLASGERLVLGRLDGSSTVAAPVNNLRWPVLAGDLPPGPLRDAVAPVTGIRALMVSAEERRRLRRLELLNQDGKTVARVDLDEPASTAGATGVEAGGAAPIQVTVRTLRGYDEQARRADRLLIDLGLQAVEQDQESLPGVVPSSPLAPAADRAAPARVLLTAALGGFLMAMRENLPGLLDDVDTEFLHDFRVAVRRTRATLKLGRPALSEAMQRKWEPAFKSLGDLTTPVRDLDVYELDLPTMSRWLLTADPSDLDPLARHLRGHREEARRTLLRSLRSAAFGRLLMEWGEELAQLGAMPEGADQGHLSAGQLADHSISRAYRRVARDGGLIGVDSPAEDLHGLRKRCKELRYALEVFAPLIDHAARKRAVTDLKGLQDVLGRFQDSEVQRQALRGFAEEMMVQGTTAGAMLAMGELIGHLDVEQDRARREFHVVFARFERPSSLQLMQRLGGDQ